MWSSNKTGSREIRNLGWSQFLYEHFIQSPSSYKFERTFGCVITNRSSALTPFDRFARHHYSGTKFVQLDMDEYFKFETSLSFAAKGGEHPIEETDFGYVSFGETLSQTPSLHLLVKDHEEISARFDKLFTEVKSSGGLGIEVFFDINVESILGFDAKTVWGSPGTDNDCLPGRQPFPFCSIEFKASI